MDENPTQPAVSRRRTYFELVRPLPRPTDGQVEAFIDHVADADNWLKLLPLGGGPELTVFLDPSAGARVNRVRDTGRYAVELLGPQTELVHGSEQPTDEYRRRFGFLNYHIRLGGGTAGLEAGLMLRALLPEPGIVHMGAFVPLPERVRTTAGRPGAFLHGTFRGAGDRGGVRRFRFAVERLAKLEGVPEDDPLVQRIGEWARRCKEEDQSAFAAWLRAAHDESAEALDEAPRWRRYVEWRDEEACTRLHESQDEAFGKTGIPEAVVAAHAQALDIVRGSARAMLAVLDELGAS